MNVIMSLETFQKSGLKFLRVLRQCSSRGDRFRLVTLPPRKGAQLTDSDEQ